MTKLTDKQRADAAEAKLAELVIRNFEHAMRTVMEDTTMKIGSKFAKIFRAAADLLDSGVPLSVMGPLLERSGLLPKDPPQPDGSSAVAPSPQEDPSP